MTGPQVTDASLEGMLKDEILRMYEEVAENPRAEFHFFHGREAAEMFEYDREWLDRAPEPSVASFAGVGNPHLRSNIVEGETVVDLGSGGGSRCDYRVMENRANRHGYRRGPESRHVSQVASERGSHRSEDGMSGRLHRKHSGSR